MSRIDPHRFDPAYYPAKVAIEHVGRGSNAEFILQSPTPREA